MTLTDQERVAELELQLEQAKLEAINAREADNAPVPVQHVAVRIPPFTQHQSESWFRIVEAQFMLGAIRKSSTRFYHALSALPADTVSKLQSDVLESADYEQLKTAILSLFVESKTEIFNRLTSRTELHGRPSLFLAELKAQASRVGVGEELVRHRFLQAMPKALLPVLVAQAELPLDALGRLSDSLREHVPDAAVNVVEPARARARPDPQCGKPRGHAMSRPTRDAHQIPRGVAPFHEDQRPQICRAHIYFGQKARTCKPWCRFPCDKKRLAMAPSSRNASRAASPAPSPTRSPTPENE